jgi:hypothetical protein
MLINDDECDTEYPQVLDEERLMADDVYAPLPPTLLLAHTHVARLMAPLAKTFRSLCITSETLARFESHLGECLQLFPRPLHLSSTTALDPCIMAPLLSFQNARIVLHRHNLSPACSPEQRTQAIEQCLLASRDTASVISRCMMMQAQDWEQRFVLSATTMWCTHIWRCMLFLLFRQVYDAFFLLLRAAATINDTRSINISCGRNLSFFVRCLIERAERAGNLDLDQDEEMMVYLSGDLQASTNSWVWGNAETGTHLSRRQKHGRPKNAQNEHDTPLNSDPKTPSWDDILTEEEQHDWGGWQHVEQSARYLQQLSDRRRFQHVQHNPNQLDGPPHPPPISRSPLPLPVFQNNPARRDSGPTLAPINTSISIQTPPPPPPIISTSTPDGPDPNRSRMTIANII